jgi:sarcosine oxidase
MGASYDVIVVGLGGMGSACCWQLARRGLRVLGLDAFELGHTMGSSHGVNRIIRKPYYENPAYVPLVLRAYELWRDLEAASGEAILHVTGGIDAGPVDSKTFLGAVEACRIHDIAHEVLDGADLRARFPAFNLPAGTMAVFCPDSGFVLSELAIRTHLRLAESLGAHLHRPEAVLGWEPTVSGIAVTTGQGRYEAGHLVLAAGAWMADLVPQLRSVAVPERQVVGWFEPQVPELFQVGRFPVFTMKMPEGEFYGFPDFGLPGLKIGRHRHRHEATTPQTVDRIVHAADESMLRDAIRRYLPSADGPMCRAAACLYTNTPDEDFIIDRMPGHNNVVLLSPCSGHGYKFCSVVGELTADLVTEGRTALDIDFLSLGRF